MKLVIVESPNKCDTITKYLGKGYYVLASKGHLRDLSKHGFGGFGVDIENEFAPTYVVCPGKESVIRSLKEAKNKSNEVILATDPDREGEAIAWHLAQVLELDINKTKRLEFHEITRESITNAMQNPRHIDMNLVNSQETRRIMDRIIGFKLSGLVKRKMNSPSAGRVQSATLKLICDHEDEIKNFVPEFYWTLSVETLKDNKQFKLDYYQYKGDTLKLNSEENNAKVVKAFADSLKVISIKKSVKSVESKPAFSTSTLQQEAFNIYKFSTGRTTRIAQQLYEGINVGGEHIGLVTYIRTDGTDLSDTYLKQTFDYIKENFGEQYVGKRRVSKVAVNAQLAHEAIRPTSNFRTPDSIQKYLTNDQYKLYKLIYERAICSLMAPKKEEVTTIIMSSGDVSFKHENSSLLFDGYARLFNDDNKKSLYLPPLKEGDVFPISKVNNEKKSTEPPARYSEAKIVKLMEEKGIGRPSTYASTIASLVKHEYIESKAGIISPTETGYKTSFVLAKYFHDLVDASYTASMETKLDRIQEGNDTRGGVLSVFYNDFMNEYNENAEKMYKSLDEETGELCPICGQPLVRKKGRYGEFVACSNYPACNYVKKETPVVEYTGEMCPECGKPMVYRYDKKGKKFEACSGYPSCKYTKKEVKPKMELKVVKTCPACGGDLVIKKGYSQFLGCTNYPRCKYQEPYRKNDNKK